MSFIGELVVLMKSPTSSQVSLALPVPPTTGPVYLMFLFSGAFSHGASWTGHCHPAGIIECHQVILTRHQWHVAVMFSFLAWFYLLIY